MGLRRTEQLINEGKDQERYGHVEQPAYPGVDDLVAMLNPAYMVGQLERGENGTLHWQFAIQWSHSRSFAAIKKDLPLAHFEEVRSWAAAVQYCQKEDSRDSGPWEYGKPAYRRVRQGSGRGLGHVVYSRLGGAL